MFDKIDVKKITPAQKEALLKIAEKAVGITADRAAEFLKESVDEHPEKDAAWHKEDATGKFKHFLRTEHGWGGAVDGAWPFLEEYAAAAVDTVIATGA